MNIFTNFAGYCSKHSAEILIELGISLSVFGTVSAVKATTIAKKKLDSSTPKGDKYTAGEVFKLCWMYYIPTVIAEVGSAACLIGSNRISSKKTAAFAAAYSLSETALHEYKDQVKKAIGESKEQKIQDSTNQEIVNKTSQNPTTVIMSSNDGDCLFYEPIFGRYFKSNWTKIQQACSKVNARAINGAFCEEITLSDWYNELGLSTTEISDDIGWSIRKYGEDGLLSISMGSTLTPEDSQWGQVPCGVINYGRAPETLNYN